MSPEIQKQTAVQVLRLQEGKYQRLVDELEESLKRVQEQLKDKRARLEATQDALKSIEST